MSNTTSIATNAFSAGDTAWILTSAAMVFIMIPGLGFFYAGMARSQAALSMLFLCMLSVAIVSIEWFLWGYSLALTPSSNPFIGNFNHAVFTGLVSPDARNPNAPTVHALVYAIYQSMFAAITPALAFGVVENRARILPAMVFLFVWSTLVYNFVTYWNWAPRGWAHTLGVLDFAGGVPVHTVAGMAALAYAIKLGPRPEFKSGAHVKPHNYVYILLGTAMLWFGWFGDNAGSEGAANARTANAFVVTNLSACVSAMTWTIVSYFREDKKWGSFGFCGGAVAGLVVITPACGYVAPWTAVIFGICSGVLCNYAIDLKHKLNYDDSLDVFAVHAVGGILGTFLTGIFAQSYIINLDGTQANGGWLDGNWIQVPIQLASIATGAVWSFVVTYIILMAFDYIPFLRLRLNKDQEELGMDAVEMGENVYGFGVLSHGGNTANWPVSAKHPHFSSSNNMDELEPLHENSAAVVDVASL